MTITKYLFEKHKNMAKKTIKLNEAQLRNMVAESVKNVLKEWGNPYDDGQFMYQYIDADRGDKAAEYGLGYNPAHNRASKALDYNERSGIHRKDKEVVDIMKFLWPKCSSLMLNHDPNKVIVALKNIIKEFQGMAGNA